MLAPYFGFIPPSRDRFTSLMLHGLGPDTSTQLTDVSVNRQAMTAVSGAKISTAQSKFGGSSILLNGTTDYYSATSIAPMQLGSLDFTLECWMRFTVAGSWAAIAKVGEWEWYGDTSRWVFKVNNATNVILINNTPSTGVWIHYALTRKGTVTTMYVNGASIGTGTSTNITDGAGQIRIGNAVTSIFTNGNIQEVRVSKGIARWTANFQPPPQMYQ